MAYQMISILSFGVAHKHTHLWATQCGSDNPRRRERITLQRREKGHGAEREREKLEGEGGGGAEETYGQNPLSSPSGLLAKLPAGVSEAITKSQLHSPFREQL